MKTRLIFAILAALALRAHAFPISYSYDAAGRLRGVNYAGSSNTEFTYDADGNLLARVSTTNQFIPLAGIYNGLITGNTPTFSNTGTISIVLTSGGLFTGTITLDEVKYAIRGQFDPTTDEPMVPVKIRNNTITVSLVLGNGQITGGLSNGESAVITTMISPFNKKTNPLPGGLVGSYTAMLTGTDFSQGTGYGTVTVGADGSVKFTGALADGTKVTQGAMIGQDETWPIFLLLYNKGGFVSGDVAFADMPGVSDFAGTVAWMKPATAGPIYPAVINENLSVLGSKYVPPAKDQTVLNFGNASPNGLFEATGGNLVTDPLDNNFLLPPTNKITPVLTAHKLKLTIATASGLFSGNFTDTGATTRTFGGVIFQKQNMGGGFFLGTSESGMVTLEEAP